MRTQQRQELRDMGFDPDEYEELSDQEMDDFLEFISNEPLVNLSLCCGADIENGFCTVCGEHANAD